MKINIKEVSNPFLNVPNTNSKRNVRTRKHYSTIKKNPHLSLFDSPSYKQNDNDDNNYYENILKRINGNDPPKNITFPSTPSGTKSKHMKIMYSSNGVCKKQKGKSCHNLTVSAVNQKMAKSLVLSSKKRNISNEIIKSNGSLKTSVHDNNSNMNNSNNNVKHKEGEELLLNSNDINEQNNNLICNKNKNSMNNLHREKLNIINEENGDDYTVNANSKISFKKNSKSSLETVNIKPFSETGKKNIFNFVQVETANQVEIHPVKISKNENIETNNMTLSNVGQSNQIEHSSSHTTNKPPLTHPTKKEIIQPLKASIKSHNSSNSFSSVNKNVKKKNIFFCCLPIK